MLLGVSPNDPQTLSCLQCGRPERTLFGAGHGQNGANGTSNVNGTNGVGKRVAVYLKGVGYDLAHRRNYKTASAAGTA